MFDLGWPHLGEVLAHYVHTVVSRGQRVLLLITYHYSNGDKYRGCAGFNYDTQAARASTYAIRGGFDLDWIIGHHGDSHRQGDGYHSGNQSCRDITADILSLESRRL
jgi:hypothetical protein